MLTLVAEVTHCFLQNKFSKICFQTQTCFSSYFSTDGRSVVDICFGHMRDISLMLLELKERHLEGWRGALLH